MQIFTNTNVLFANKAFNRNSEGLASTMKRLSSGMRVNSAKDDAAGLAIGERFTSQVRGTTVAMRNANDAISMLQTADGGLEEITNMIQRMRELSVQAANTAVMGPSERKKLQNEVDQLSAEITRIAKDLDFNGVSILNDGAMFSSSAGGDDAAVVQGLARAWLQESEDMITQYFGLTPTGGTLTVDLTTFTDGPLGTIARVGSAGAYSTALSLQIDMADFANPEVPGDGGQLDLGIAEVAYDRIIAHEMVHAVTANATDSTGLPTWFKEGTSEFIHGADERVLLHGGVAATYGAVNLSGAWGGTSQEYAGAYLTVRYLHTLAGGNTDGAVTTSGIAQVFDEYENNGHNLLNAINTATGGAYATINAFLAEAETNTISSGAVTEASLNDADTGAIGGANAEAASAGDVTRVPQNSTVVPNTNNLNVNPTRFNVVFPIDPASEVSSGFAKSVNFQIGANEGEILSVGLVSATAKALNIDDLDLVKDAALAIGNLDFAINVITKQRARLGAQMNRMEKVVNILETTNENTSAARSRIMDADYAKETVELARSQIVSQASTAMTAQAQASSQLALHLLSSF